MVVAGGGEFYGGAGGSGSGSGSARAGPLHCGLSVEAFETKLFPHMFFNFKIFMV